ncbi:MAG: hypothetical protein ITD33_00125 [Nitrosarchaeum sp.]|nr:hypothetical protein [Nitrosarchaeum sp.]
MIIENNTYIHPTAVIGPNVIIGNDCYIGPLCVIGYPAEYKGKEHLNAGVIIGDGTRLTGMVTIDTGTDKATQIGERCYLMKHSYVAHDVILGNNVTLSAGAKIGGHSVIGNDCNIGMNAAIHQKVTMPQRCMIGASAFVGKKTFLNPYRKYAGVPAKDIGENLMK